MADKDIINRIKELKDNDVLFLNGKTFDVKKEDCFFLSHFYCTNSNSLEHNPNGEKHIAFYLKDKNNVIIDGQGAVITLHGEVTPILLDNCHNVVVKNITFDYAVPSMFEFKVVSSCEGMATIKPNNKNKYLIKDNSLFWVSDLDPNGKYYYCYEYNGKDVLSMGLNQDGHLYYLPYSSSKSRFPSIPEIGSIKENDNKTLSLIFKDKTAKLNKNDVIQARHTSRKEVGGYFNCSSDICLDNVNYHFMNGMGLIFQGVDNISLNKISIIPSDDRVISSCADFFHFSSCKGEIKVSNCAVCGAHDDLINVHGVYLLVHEVNEKENKITLRFPHHETFGFNPFSPDEMVEFVNKDTLLPVAKAKIKESHLIDLNTVSITVDKLDHPLVNCVADNLSRKPSLIVERCRFERIATRAILATTDKKVIIRNNVFKNINGPLLSVSNDANEWFESGRAGIISLENNIIDSCNSGPRGQGEPIVLVKPSIKEDVGQIIHQKLFIKDNQFVNSCCNKFVFNLSHLEEFALENNKFTSDFEIKKDCVSKVSLNNNTILKN